MPAGTGPPFLPADIDSGVIMNSHRINRVSSMRRSRHLGSAIATGGLCAMLTACGTSSPVGTAGADLPQALTRHQRMEVGREAEVGRLPPEQVMTLDIVLPLRDPDGLDRFLGE